MKRLLKRVAAFALAMLVPASTAIAQAPSREFAPVQNGYVAQGEQVSLYAGGRVLVKFTRDAARQVQIQMDQGGLQRSTVGVTTGLATFDAATQDLQVQQLEQTLRYVPRDAAAVSASGADRWFTVEFDASMDAQQIATRLAGDPNVESASVDWRAFPAAVPNDPMHTDHWGHNNTAQLNDLDWGGTYAHTLPNTVGTPGFDANAEQAWDGSQGYGSSSVIIAIVDSGVDVGHPDLVQVAGYDYGDNDSNADDNSSQAGHGTACAGVAAASANNGLGTAGIAANSRIMPLKVANSAGSMYFSAIINAIYHAADNGADIISMSLGAAISSDAQTDAAIQYAYNAGCVLLAATGNENASSLSYPANNALVIGVGAASPCGERKRSSASSSEVNPGVNTDPNGYTCDGERWWGSNYGTNSADAAGAVDIIAPTILPTTDIQGSGGYASGDYDGWFNGTSCATPYAAGVVALIKAKNPSWTPAQLRNQLVNTAEDVTSVESGSGWDRYTGYGMVDAAAAVDAGGPVTNPPVAAFTGSPTSGTFPLTVNFTDQSTESPTGWSWTFGDGGSSSAQNPSHTYTSAGTYTVSLTASNAYGSDGETKTGYITVTDPADTYASLPYSTGFESGLDQYWTTSEGVEGRIEVTTANGPYAGSYHLRMDDSVSGGSYSQNEAWLQLNLAGEGQVDLEFYWKEIGDENHTQDGVFFSDDGGASFTKVLSLNGQSTTNNTWQNFQLDVDALASSNGLSLTSQFVVKFQQYDNYPVNSDGFCFDEISVTSGPGGSPPVAEFSGTPTSGTLPLNVQFTDASTGGATAWSWTFGDGGTSTAQNPSHTYNAAGSYTVTLTASNAFGNDVESKSAYVTVTDPGGGGQWESISSSDFESGWQGWADGGSDARRSSRDAAYAHQGTYCIRLRDDTSTSTMTSSAYDLTGYAEVEIDFWYYPRSMDNDNEGFFLQMYNGSSWVTIGDWRRGADFQNNGFYNETVSVTSSQVNFASNAQLRFRCDGSGNSDWVYIDEVEFSGLTAGGSAIDFADGGLVVPREFTLGQNHPNPFNPLTVIDFALPKDAPVRVDVFDTRGRRVTTLADGHFPAGAHQLRWDATAYSSGVYYYRIVAGDFVQTRRMTLIK